MNKLELAALPQCRSTLPANDPSVANGKVRSLVFAHVDMIDILCVPPGVRE